MPLLAAYATSQRSAMLVYNGYLLFEGTFRSLFSMQSGLIPYKLCAACKPGLVSSRLNTRRNPLVS